MTALLDFAVTALSLASVPDMAELMLGENAAAVIAIVSGAHGLYRFIVRRWLRPRVARRQHGSLLWQRLRKQLGRRAAGQRRGRNERAVQHCRRVAAKLVARLRVAAYCSTVATRQFVAPLIPHPAGARAAPHRRITPKPKLAHGRSGRSKVHHATRSRR